MAIQKILQILSAGLVLITNSWNYAQSPVSEVHGVRNDLPQPYETQRTWGELPDGTASWAAVTAVEPSPDGRFIYVIHRCLCRS